MSWIVDLLLDVIVETLPRPVRRAFTALGALVVAAIIGRALF